MDMEELMRQAQEAAQTIQKQMNDVQVKLDSIEVEGTSGGGLVKIRATAKGRILSVSIDDSLIVPADKQIWNWDRCQARTRSATESGTRRRRIAHCCPIRLWAT